MLLENKTIAIVGGGPGGLTLARLLQQSGETVTVYERDLNRAVRVQGATLDLHEESGLKALQKASLMAAFDANYRPGADKLRLTDKYATILFDDDSPEQDGSSNADNGRTRPEIDRGPLRDILLNSLKPDTVVWDSYLQLLEPAGDAWKLTFQNGTSATADIVIAADGANSKIRPHITPIRPFYAGITVVEGAVYNTETACPTVHKLLNGGKIFALGDSKSLIVSSKGDGSLVFYTGCKTDENWFRNSGLDFTDKTQMLAWFRQEFSGWANLWEELFDNAEPRFTPRPQYCMPLDQQWPALPNLTMLGDAAHLMPPYAGEGVNMAMLDALELSTCLTSDEFPDVQSAIASYEQQMSLRFAEIGSITLAQTASLHSPDALSGMLNLLT